MAAVAALASPRVPTNVFPVAALRICCHISRCFHRSEGNNGAAARWSGPSGRSGHRDWHRATRDVTR